MFLRWLPLLVILLGSCPGAAHRSAAAAAEYALAYADDTLSLECDGAVVCDITAQQPVPYAIAATGPPALVTTCGADLRPVTYAAGDPPLAYRDMLPVVCDPPLVALAPLPDTQTLGVTATMLLKPDGGVLWQAPECELLAPGAGATATQVAYLAMARDGGVLTPLGRPRLSAVDTASGALMWEADLASPAAAVAVELWALTAEYGLLSLQYSYEAYEFVTFSRQTGALGRRTRLTGQPATVQVYPGLVDEPAQVVVDGGAAELLIFPLGAAPQTWRFELASGAVAKSAIAGAIPGPRREENALPVGGGGTPGPGGVPFPQTVLPTQSGAQWRIPALLDARRERVLVVDSAGARWVDITGAQ